MILICLPLLASLMPVYNSVMILVLHTYIYSKVFTNDSDYCLTLKWPEVLFGGNNISFYQKKNLMRMSWKFSECPSTSPLHPSPPALCPPGRPLQNCVNGLWPFSFWLDATQRGSRWWTRWEENATGHLFPWHFLAGTPVGYLQSSPSGFSSLKRSTPTAMFSTFGNSFLPCLFRFRMVMVSS